MIVAGIALSIAHGIGGNVLSASGNPPGKPAATYSDFKGKRIGIRTGTSLEDLTFKYLPDSQYFYYDTESDLVTALTGNKIDAFLNDEPVAEMMHIENNAIDFIQPCIVEDNYCFGFPKNKDGSDKIMAEFNEVLGDLRKKGELDKMKKKWLSKDDSQKTFDDTPLTGENGTLTVAVVGDKVPFSYMFNNKLTGYNVELVTIFAREKGMTMLIVTHEMKFAKDVSTRVFYMDEGGIYEEGTPKQIFEDPQKPRTRVFIKRLKQFNLTIENRHFDYVSCLSGIGQFGKDNQIREKTVNDLQLIFEEVIKQGITKKEGVFPVEVTMEYSGVDESVTVNAEYGGEDFDPITNADEISAAIVKGVAPEIKHTFEDGRNRLSFLVRNP